MIELMNASAATPTNNGSASFRLLHRRVTEVFKVAFWASADLIMPSETEGWLKAVQMGIFKLKPHLFVLT
jgi:hypothetical protein